MTDTLLATLAKINTDVRSVLCELTEGFYLDTEITNWSNEAQEEIANETFCLRTWKTYTLKGLVGETNDIFDLSLIHI